MHRPSEFPFAEEREDRFPAPDSTDGGRGARIAEVARVFLRLGVTSFGGPAAHISAMESELVRVRKWVAPTEFLDLMSAVNLIPGPNSTELAIHLGFRRAGWAGLVVAGCAFIGPASALVWIIAIAYVRFGARPDVSAFMQGMQPVVLAVIAHATWRLARSVLRSPTSIIITVLCVAAALAGVHELIVLAGAAAAGLLNGGWRTGAAQGLLLSAPPSAAIDGRLAAHGALTATTGAALLSVPSSLGVFGAFLKIGSLLFGSGYVLLAFMRAEFVQRHAWLTESQLLDAIAIGQLTPGPVFSAATFAGYLMAGNGGAAAATAGVFLPAFVFVALSGPLVRALRRSPRMSAMFDGVNAASLALLMTVALLMLRTVATSGVGLGIFAVASVLLFRLPVGAGTVLLGGAAVGAVRWWLMQ